jgi:hypothetical protein
MPSHLLHSAHFFSASDQALIALSGIVFTGLCVRYWRITLTILAALLLGAALIALSVVVDLHIIREITGYLHDLGHLIAKPFTSLSGAMAAGLITRR